MTRSFTRFWARALIAAGIAVIVLGAVTGAFVGLVAPAVWLDPLGSAGRVLLLRVAIACGISLGAIVLGAPLIVGGRLLLIVLDQRALLARQRSLLIRILRRLPRETLSEPPQPPRPPRAADERFRWRQ
ncbi:MAG: hypothetical protein HY727_07705 [Candidatus Rokubacteria bacterium]|nr:hypothetical protein [Candidatus Rokubacteria bacterium]